MKKIITLSIVFLLSFIVFCIIKLPAAVAIDLAKPYFPKQLEVGQSVGTIWQGQMMQVRYQGEQLNNVRWDVESNQWVSALNS